LRNGICRFEGDKAETGNEIGRKRENASSGRSDTNTNSALEYCGGDEIDK